MVFTSLETAQALANRPGMVNDLVLTVAPGADPDEVEAALVAEMSARYPEMGVSLMRTEDDPSYRALTNDPKGDQAFYNVFATVIFVGAAFAALNLAARMVEAQRREIGTSMALGVPPRSIAARPLLVGLQIGVLGVVFGVGDRPAGGQRDGRRDPGLRTAAGVLDPVPDRHLRESRRARVCAPHTGGVVAGVPRGAGGAGGRDQDGPPGGARRREGPRGQPAPLAAEQPWPDAVPQLAARARRTLLTLFALTAVIAILISVIGMMDSFVATIVRGDEELIGDVPDRLTVELDSFYPITSPEVTGVMDGGALRVAEPALALGGGIRGGGGQLNVLLQFVDFESELWRPTAIQGGAGGHEARHRSRPQGGGRPRSGSGR